MPIAILIDGGFRTWDDSNSYKELKVRWWRWRRYYIVHDPEDGQELRVPVRYVRCLELVTTENYQKILEEKEKKKEGQKNAIMTGGPGRFIGIVPGGRRG